MNYFARWKGKHYCYGVSETDTVLTLSKKFTYQKVMQLAVYILVVARSD